MRPDLEKLEAELADITADRNRLRRQPHGPSQLSGPNNNARSTARMIADTASMISQLERFYGGSTLQKSQDALSRMKADLGEMRRRLEKLEAQGITSGAAAARDRLQKLRR